MPQDADRELTVLETAMVMALDMMGAGIDTVINFMQKNLF
jgi:hypothetical protein